MAMEKKTKAATETGLYLVVLLGIVVVINVLSYGCGSIHGVYKRVDATKNERFTLSQGSARLIGTLKQPIQADIYVTRGLASLDAFVRDMEDLLKEYERAGGGKFRYAIIEAKSEEEREKAKKAGLKEVPFADVDATGEDKASIAQGFMGILFKYGSEKDTIPYLPHDRTDGLEFWITNKIREIRDKADNISHTIGVVTNKDEIKISDANLVAGGGGKGGPSIKALMQQHFPFYKFEDVDLKDGATEINPELNGLLITQPGKDYNDKELRRIDQFVMRGKSLTVLASAANLKESDGTMKATLDLHNLDKLLKGYGIEMAKDVALDWGRPARIPVLTQSRQLSWILAPGIAHVQYFAGVDEKQQMLDNGFAGFFRIEDLAFPFPSSLTIHPDRQPGMNMKVVARTSPNAAVATGETVVLRPSPDQKPKPPLEQRAIAAVVEGKLKSAMASVESKEGADIKIPAESTPDCKIDAEGQTEGTCARVLVISSSHFLANPFARAGKGPDLGPQFAMMGNIGGDEVLQAISQPYAQQYLTATILAFKNTLDWMSGDSDLIATSAKILGEPNLTYSDIQPAKLPQNPDEDAIKAEFERVKEARKKTQSSVQWTLTALLPLLFAGFGVARWQWREKSRSKISLD